MKKSKKRIVILISVLLTLCIGFSGSALALDSSLTASVGSKYIMTEIVPQDAIDYAKENVAESIYLQLFYDQHGVVSQQDLSKYELGTPYVIEYSSPDASKVYHFPVFSGNEVVFTYYVTKVIEEDSSCFYFGQIVPRDIDQLNQISNTAAQAVQLNENLGTVTASRQVSSYTRTAGEGYSFVSKSPVNAAQRIPYAAYTIQPRRGSNLLHPTIVETQLNDDVDSWCVGYTAAMAINYRKGVTSYRSTSVANYNGIYYKGDFIPVSGAAAYARHVGLSTPVVNREGDNQVAEVSSWVDQNLVVPSHWSLSGNSDASGHTMAIVGYTTGYLPDGSSSTYAYYIWDPYFSYTTATQIAQDNTAMLCYHTSVNGKTFVMKGYSVYK